MPVRGNAPNSGVRIEAKPESRPRQNGEFADSASSSGSVPRRPSSARTAVSASGTPRGRAAPSSARDAPAPASSPRPRDSAPPDAVSTSSPRASGCVPATAARRPSRSRAPRPGRAQPAQLVDRRRAPSRAAPVLSSTTHACVSARHVRHELRGKRREHVVDPVGRRPVARIEQQHLLLDADGPRPSRRPQAPGGPITHAPRSRGTCGVNA